jgi:hypothetical protein
MSAVISQNMRKAIFAENSTNASGVSLCIPRVFNNIPWYRVKQHMIDCQFGFVERVDVVPVRGKDGKVSYKRAYVHFRANSWNMRDKVARDALNHLQSGEEVQVTYDGQWYWKVSISTAKKPSEAPKPKERKHAVTLAKRNLKQMKKKIDLGDSNVVTAGKRVDKPRDDPIKARELENRVSDEDLEKYSHLSEQAANFMASEEMKELSSM